jgi:hypothetical protein
MSYFPGERGRRDGDDRAPSVGQAVAAHLAADEPGQRATAASTHDQQVTGAAGQTDQDPASLTPLYERLDQWVVGNFSPRCDQRIPEPPAGVLLPDAAQVAAGLTAVGEITARRHPGKDGYQGGITGAGQVLRVPQCPEAAR